MSGDDPAGAPDPDAALRAIEAEHDRDDAEAVRAFDRELATLDRQHAHALDAAAAAARATLQLEQAKAEAQLQADRIRASRAADEALNALFHEKVAEVAVAGVERARDNAKFVQTAASAVFAVYTGLLALVYSVTDNPLPLRGAWAGVFLGLSVAFATAYLSFPTDDRPVQLSGAATGGVQLQYARTANLVRWIRAGTHRRTYASRAAVLSLLFGVLFITAPFVSTTAPTAAVPAPAAPQAPGQVEDAFEETALRLFEAQVEDYENAVAARAAALAAAEESATDRADQEEDLNRYATVAAGGALVVVLVGPVLFGWVERFRARRATRGGPRV